MRASSSLSLCALLGAIGACYVGAEDLPSAHGPGGGSAHDAGPAGSSDAAASAPPPGATGLPCDVDAIVRSRCHACHGPTPTAPMALVAYDDFAKPSARDPKVNVAARALARMTDGQSPMPPTGAAPSSEVAVFRGWVEAGLPRGACGADAGAGSTDAGSTAPQCTSGVYWQSGKKGSSMQPGRACIDCHSRTTDKGPIVAIGGTVYPSLHEPDTCFGVDGAATPARVEITDAQGRVFSLPVGPTGNFSLDARNAIAMPFRAKVIAGGKERAMTQAQSTGDCNSCHTVGGANGAPGRILAP